MKMPRIDLAIVQQQITALLLQVPELAEDDILRADMIEGETDFLDLLRQLEAKRLNTLAMIKGLKPIIKQLNVRKARMERSEDGLRSLALKLMQHAEIKKAVLPEATYSIANGRQKVIITDEARIPEDFCRIKIEPDKTKIGDSIKAGHSVPGCELSNAEPYLSIR